MECSAYREAISARIDGEDGGLEVEAVDAHLSSCPACRTWAETATTVTRAARLGLADPVPDLANQIMAAITDVQTAASGTGARPARARAAGRRPGAAGGRPARGAPGGAARAAGRRPATGAARGAARRGARCGAPGSNWRRP